MNLPRLASLVDYLDYHAGARGAEEAVVDGQLRLTWRALADGVHSLAEGWRSAGLQAGDRIAFVGAPGVEFWLSLMAAHRLRLVWVGLNPQYSGREMSHVLADAQPRVVLVAENATDAAREALSQAVASVPTLKVYALYQPLRLESTSSVASAELASAGIAMLVYTSGTTGQPKGALITRAGLVENGWWIAQRLGGEPHRTLVNLPVNHIGCVGDVCATAFVAGGTLVFMPGFDPEAAVPLLRAERIEWLPQVPAQFQLLLSKGGLQREDLVHLRCLMWGGAPMPKPLIRQFRDWVPDLANSYGLSECSGTITISAPCSSIDALAETVGAPVSADRVRIANTLDHALPAGECGEVQIHGPHLFHGYLNRPDATAEAMTADGWLKTGDLGRLNSDGNLELLGRTREMFKSGGYNVYPREVESVLESYPGVELCAVVGVPDPLWTEIGVAFVQADPAVVSEESLRRHCQQGLANYKVPKQFCVAAELPLLPIGKLDKQSLRAGWLTRRSTDHVQA